MSESVEGADEAANRRKRTTGYLKLWGLTVDLSPLGVPLVGTHDHPDTEAVVGRAKALCLVGLKGQGLSVRETFAFADAYGVWDHLTVAENDFVLDTDPPVEDLVMYAWKFEGLRVMEWALGLVKHLAFPAEPASPATATELCVHHILNAPEGDSLSLRSTKELLDGADVAWCISAVSAALRASPVEGLTVDHGIVHERALAFDWLVRAVHRSSGV